MERHHAVQDIPKSGFAWTMLATLPSTDSGFLVSMGLGAPDIIGFSLTVQLAQWQSSLNSLAIKERKEFLYDLRLRLLSFNVESPIPLEDLPKVIISTVLYVEELGKPKFWSAIYELQKAAVCVLWSFEKKFTLDADRPIYAPGSQGAH